MPFRAMGKMTMGACPMPMVHAIVDIVNGHFWRGISAVVRGFFRARSQHQEHGRANWPRAHNQRPP